MSIKLKSADNCSLCSSCLPMFTIDGKNAYYCNMKKLDPKNSQADISTCKVDPGSKPDDCPLNGMNKFIETLGFEDQLGLKFIAKIFGGKDNKFFEEDEIQPTIGKWIETDKMLPKERDWYLGVFKESDTGWINPVPFICGYLLGEHTAYTTNDGWIIKDCTDNDDAPDYYKNLQCVAWMPLPKPYNKDERGW